MAAFNSGNTGIKYGNTGNRAKSLITIIYRNSCFLLLLVARFVVLGRVREEHEDLL